MLSAWVRRRIIGNRLNGEAALHGDSLHLSHLRRVFDPLTVSPDLRFDRSLILLAFTNRSGSTHLGQLLASMPDLCGFREDLNHNIVAKRTKAEGLPDLSAYLSHIVRLNTTPRAGFGLKASGEQLRLARMTGIDRAFRDTKVIRIHRRDRVAQAVSLWMAWHTRQWTSRQDAPTDLPTYDLTELRSNLRSVQNAESALDLVLSVLPYEVQTVEYETLCEHQAAVLSDLRIGLGLPSVSQKVESWTERQTSPEKAEIVERFRRDLARHWSLPET